MVGMQSSDLAQMLPMVCASRVSPEAMHQLLYVTHYFSSEMLQITVEGHCALTSKASNKYDSTNSQQYQTYLN